MKLFVVLFFMAAGLRAEVKPAMQEYFSLTSRISPYLMNKAEYLAEKNEKEIGKALAEFVENSKRLKQEKMIKNDDLKFRAKLLGEGLDIAEKSFNDGFKDYSFWVLKASLNNCFSCHTQKALSTTHYEIDKKSAPDLYSRAEFLFIVRNYDEAVPLLKGILTGYPDNEVSVENLESTSQKLLFYLMRVAVDDKKSVQIFNEILKNRNLPKTLKSDVLAWKKYLTVKKYRIEEETPVTDAESLEKFMTSRTQIASHYSFSNQRAIADLDTTRFLYRLLEDPQSRKFRPWVLYWLATIEKDYRLSMFDMSAENYLKECIEKYPKNPAAKKCFAAFEEMQMQYFTGTRGPELPPDIIRLINKYRKLTQ